MSVLLRALKWPKIRTQNWPNQHIQISLERFGFWQWLLKTQMSFIYVSTTSIIGLLSSTTSEQSNGPSHNTGRIPQYEDWPYPPYQGNAEDSTFSDVTGPAKVPDLTPTWGHPWNPRRITLTRHGLLSSAYWSTRAAKKLIAQNPIESGLFQSSRI